jgi:ABC-type lipopolysaccharide export system ATPase subunit
MLDGEIAVEGTPDAFRAHETVRGRYLGTWQRSLPPPPP